MLTTETLPLQADHTIELNPEGLSTGTLLAVAGTHHAHAEKTSGKIGEAFPEGGYGAYLHARPSRCSLRTLFFPYLRRALLCPVRLSVDEFYVFTPRATAPPPSKLSASEFKPQLDLVGAALSRDGPASEELVSLASGKSGLRVGFASNRKPSPLPCVPVS